MSRNILRSRFAVSETWYFSQYGGHYMLGAATMLRILAIAENTYKFDKNTFSFSVRNASARI